MYNSNKKVSYMKVNLFEEVYRASRKASNKNNYKPTLLESVNLINHSNGDILDSFKGDKDCIVFVKLPGSLALKELMALRELRESILLNMCKFERINTFIKTRKADIEQFLYDLSLENECSSFCLEEFFTQQSVRSIYLIDTFDYGAEKDEIIRQFKELAALTSKRVVELHFEISEQYLATRLDLISLELGVTFSDLERLVILDSAKKSHDKFEHIIHSVLTYKTLNLFPSSASDILELIDKGRKYDQIVNITKI